MQNCRVLKCPFNFKSGIIIWNSWTVDEKAPITEQLWEYGEDLFLVEYKKGGLALDIEWKQHGKRKSGQFVLCLVEGANWEKPLIKSVASSLRGLKRIVKNAVNLAESIEQKA